MNNYLLQIGSNPSLSLAEISAVFPSAEIVRTKSFALLKNAEIPNPQNLIDKMGGTIRISEVFFQGDKKELIPKIAEYLTENQEGKIKFGVSCFGFNENRTLLIGVKKELKKMDFSSRFANRNFRNLDAGTVHKERLLGQEIVVIKQGKTHYASVTLGAQNVEKLAERDYKKPARSMSVGMIPLKLAMIMLNLARSDGELPQKIYDPFCGTGTLLTEASRMGINSVGSDISKENLELTRKNYQHFLGDKKVELFVHDATKALNKPIVADAICAETFLGPIFSRVLNERDLAKAKKEVEPILEGFFRTLHKNFKGDKVVIAMPVWRCNNGKDTFLEKTLEIMQKFWENTLAFCDNTERNSLIYRRDSQAVGREIFVLKRKNIIPR